MIGYRGVGVGYPLGLVTLLLVSPGSPAVAQCPWGRDPQLVELQTSCLCAINLSQELTVQCSAVNFTVLTAALREYARESPIDMVYVNNSAVSRLEDGMFRGLKISNIQISNADLESISQNAFRGLEDTLQGLNLADNELDSVPVETLRTLRILSSLDLSNNNIRFLPSNAFVTLRLKTLKLSDNNVTLADDSLAGLEQSLKNLNLKGCHLKTFPPAIKNLGGLAFLDLAQNHIQEISRTDLAGMGSLTALNLERNVIQRLDESVFQEVNKSLSSLSLLNNLLTTFPTTAINSLQDLRVLDLGFNLLRSIPNNAFSDLRSLTLLALDGNPMASVPEDAFLHLNSSLKGLSLGGRFLTCDCRMAWVPRWIQEYDLQVTSRERNPQFCGNPSQLRERSFYQLNENDLTCAPPSTERVPSTTPLPPTNPPTNPPIPSFPRRVMNSIPPREPNPAPFPETVVRSSLGGGGGSVGPTTRFPPQTSPGPRIRQPSPRPGDVITELKMEIGSGEPVLSRREPFLGRETQPLIGRGSSTISRRPEIDNNPVSNSIPRSLDRSNSVSESRPNDLILRPDSDFIAQEALVEDVIVKEAYKEDNSIVIKWDSETTNILGFRVIYRLFGTPLFKQGPPLAPSEREFKIKNVPDNECIVVCVVSLEEVEITPANVPYPQCREMRTEGIGGAKKLDNIIIPASTAIVVCVIVAVIIFIACLKSSNKKSKKLLEDKPIHTLSMSMNGLNMAGLGPPVAPLAGLASLGLSPHQKDWDQLSMYSQKTDRSVNRGRMYHMDPRQGTLNGGYIPEDARSHISQMSTRSRSRSMADGRSEHGLFGQGGYQNKYQSSRNDIRSSRQSLVDDGRRSRASALNRSMARKSTRQSTRSRSRSRSRDNLTAYRSSHGDRGSSGYRSRGSRDGDSLPDSDNWDTTTDNNWTDYDQDVYTVRNHSKSRYTRDDVNL